MKFERENIFHVAASSNLVTGRTVEINWLFKTVLDYIGCCLAHCVDYLVVSRYCEEVFMLGNPQGNMVCIVHNISSTSQM